jgi:hypothetical protein
VELGEIGGFDCVLEWIASSCIECEGLECLGLMNGGGWVVFIAPNHFLAVAPFLPTADGPRPWSGRSAPAHQRLKSQRSVTAISTAILHLMRRQMSDKGSRGWSGLAPRTVREDTIIHFPEPVTFAFESRLGGVNRANLKFTNLITTTSRVSVRNIIESVREDAKQIASE